MSKNTYFTGQPVYGQGINLLDRADNHQKKRIRFQMDELFSESILPFGKEVGNLRYELMSECYLMPFKHRSNAVKTPLQHFPK